MSKICILIISLIISSIGFVYFQTESSSTYYPPIEPYRTGYLQVDPEHSIYWEESGNPQGSPILFLHGGPGSGTDPNQRRFFDPSYYRIILFDQRGSGKSIPLGSVKNNTTWDLVQDINKLRTFLEIDQCILFGGSWGSTLALSYAIKYPNHVKGLILRAIFLCQDKELDWFYKNGANYLSPDPWQLFLAAIPAEQQDNLIAAYHKLLHAEDPLIREKAAANWIFWEYANSQLIPDSNVTNLLNSPLLFTQFTDLYAAKIEPIARIESHYFIHKGFFPSDRWILDHASTISHIPTTLIQGRYDLICPVVTAAELHRALPESRLQVIPNGGHSAEEPSILDALIKATDAFKNL